MKYFEYICLPLFLLVCFWPIVRYYNHIKICHFYKLIFAALYKKQKQEPYVSSFYLMQIVRLLVKKHQHKALIALTAGRIGTAETFLKKHGNAFLALVLKTMQVAAKNVADWENFIKKNPENKAAIAELAVLYFNENNFTKTKQCLDNLPISGKKNYTLARSLFLQAYFDAKEGDLLSASVHTNQAAQIFHKLKAFYEEAQAYMVSGIIYRTAIISDVAQMMFDTALKIFQALNLKNEEAKIFGNLGMLMAIQKRFDEALDYYDKALTLYAESKQQVKSAEIYNQKGQLCLMQDNAAKAEEMASKALKIHQKEKNPAGIAFSKEILAYSAWAQKNYADVIQLTFEAKNLYLQLENFSAGYENLHLMALALYEQNKLDESEKILREITSKDRHYETNFHIANAYNLLGLIYLKKKEIKRAKGLFQQSLDLEQVNNRLSGIATDYANMGLIELSVGHKEQALKTFQTALDYAQANQDDELIEIIKTHLQKLQ